MERFVDFTYNDTDTFLEEIGEIYSYGEESEFAANRNAFEESMEDTGLPLAWKHMADEQKSRAINYLMTTLEVSCRSTRIRSCRSIAYLVQGNFGECSNIEEQVANCKENVFLLLEQGLFHAFVQQLFIEANLMPDEGGIQQGHLNSSNLTANDSCELRLILAVLCTITDTMYQAKDSSEPKILEMRQQFINDLQNPIGDELLSVTLFQMLNTFCIGAAAHYPVRKITLLLWKILLITLGGSQTLNNLREANRNLCNLPAPPDDTLEVTKQMRPCSPPLTPFGQARPRRVFKQTAFDQILEHLISNSKSEEEELIDANDGTPEFADDEMQQTQEVTDAYQSQHLNKERCVPKELDMDAQTDFDQTDMADVDAVIGHIDGTKEPSDESDPESLPSDPISTDFIEPSPNSDHIENEEGSIFKSDDPLNDSDTSSMGEDPNCMYNSPIRTNQPEPTRKGLPWDPKVRREDLALHMSNIRLKFLGYTLTNDLETVFGLPDPIIEGIQVLKKHLYVPLSEKQLEREELIDKYPLTHSELNSNFKDAPAEKLYRALLPKLPQYIIALLKILLAASTNPKNKSERAESIDIMSEVRADSEKLSAIEDLKLDVESSRHREIITKAVSAILLLMLKHFKVNHVYQFEYVSQQLMFANCIPLILKFLSQDMYDYIMKSKSIIVGINFPACVVGEQPELTLETMQVKVGYFHSCCWRNMFSCINLVRILNKLTKWKHSRIMMLVVFKSALTLNKALCVRQPMFQLYILKLLKVQLKFLGRQWKKTNMKLISAIYQKVRHRLTDDWAYSNDNEARPWDFQAEEFTLQANINKFHKRRYHDILSPAGAKANSAAATTNTANGYNHRSPSDKLHGVFDGSPDGEYDFDLDWDSVQISPQFERNYGRWLESEVYQRTIDWDKLVDETNG